MGSGTTRDTAGVGLGQQDQHGEHAQHRTTAELADVLTGVTLAVRAMWLPHAANGQPIAPSDPAAANIAREMADGRSQEWKRIMTKKFCDQRDGVPTEALTADLELAIAALRASAPKFRVDRPMGALNVAETKAQARLDVAQFRLAEQPADALALREALDARDHYATVFGEFSASLRHRLTIARGTTPPARQYVGRRRQLALHHA